MVDWIQGTLADVIQSLDAGVSVNAEDRPHGSGEIGVLKTSAVSGGGFHPEQNKAVLPAERRLVAEPVMADSILVSRMNTPALVGESCYLDEVHPTLFLPDRLWQLKPKDRNALSMRWLSFVLQSGEYRNHIEVHATGTSGSMKNLPKSRLLEFPVSYPPLHEQRCIAQIIDTLDTTIRQTEAIIEKLKQVKQGLLHDLLTRGIDANGELRPPQSEAPELYKESALGWIPRAWETLGLADMAHPSRTVLRTGPFGSSLKGEHLTESGRPVVTIGSLGIGKFIEEALLFVSKATANRLADFELVPGDIAFSRVADVGRSVVVEDAQRGWIMSSNFMRISINPEQVVPHFLQASMAFDSRVKRQVRSTVNSAGRDVASSAILMSLCFALPPFNEQSIIMARMQAADFRIDTENKILEKLRTQKSGLMDDLLTGRVRVTGLLEGSVE